MNIFLDLFLSFLKVGVVSFGGGLGMISVLSDEVAAHGWMTAEDFMSFVGVAESTPGPIAINMATYVGSSQGGFFGALLATLGVITPAFLIILLIAAALKNFMKYEVVGETLQRIRPAVCGLVTATGVVMVSRVLFAVPDGGSAFSFGFKSAVMFAAVVLFDAVFHAFKKKPPVIAIILFGALLGILMSFVSI